MSDWNPPLSAKGPSEPDGPAGSGEPSEPAGPTEESGGQAASTGQAGMLRRVSVSDVRVAVPSTPGVEAGMVTLREDVPPYRSLSIVIGQPEARAIHSAWSGQAARRPSTWDLFVSAVGLLDGRLDRAVITSVEERRHYFAEVELAVAGGPDRRVLPARPSDALALALRSFGAELYVDEQVFVDLGLGEPPVDN